MISPLKKDSSSVAMNVNGVIVTGKDISKGQPMCWYAHIPNECAMCIPPGCNFVHRLHILPALDSVQVKNGRNFKAATISRTLLSSDTAVHQQIAIVSYLGHWGEMVNIGYAIGMTSLLYIAFQCPSVYCCS